jgi:uncharacterized membrane protein YjgN (DUF898 family)
MSSNIDYSTYSLEELKQARATINEIEHPERAQELEERIVQFELPEASSPEALSTRASSPVATASVLRKGKVSFHGKASEFFSIWIVNLLLTIVTLGIYSAWAKVRTNRYFYGNTEIDGHRFSYLANPLQILKGRIIAVCLFASYFILSALNPIAGALLVFLLMGLTPVMVVLGQRFSMRMTGYRNVRFKFNGGFGDAFVVFVVLPFVSLFTMYLMLPWALKKIDEYLVDNSAFGDSSFTTKLSTGSYYLASLGAVGIVVAVFMVGASIMGLGFTSLIHTLENGAPLVMIALFAMYLIAYAISSSFYTALIRNHIYENSEIPNVGQFNSNVGVMPLVWLRTTNVIAIVLSLGFAIPWAKIRSAHFFANATEVTVLSGIDSVTSVNTGSVGATAEEAATLFDVDVALG